MNTTENVYNKVAPFYDVLMAHVPYHQWSKYLQEIYKFYNFQPQSALDLCCGTGLFTFYLAARGYKTYGIDNSEEMIKIAKENAAEFDMDISFICSNVTNFTIDEKFCTATCFFDSINHILDENDVLNTFQNTYQHLKAGGMFVFDVNTEKAYKTGMFNQEYKCPSDILSYKWESKYNASIGIINVDMNFYWQGEKVDVVHSQKYYPPEVLQNLLQKSGFSKIDIYESYAFQSPNKESDRIHIVAIR